MNITKIPTTAKFTVCRQLCNYIPHHLVPKLARETGVDEQARTFDEWSHIVSLCYAQVTHSIGLNDVCDALQLNSGPRSAIRGATPPSRNNLSHANKVRTADMAEALFWAEYKYLGDISPKFVSGKAAKRFARKFKRTIHVVDSTTIQLVADCMDWAKHRRRKAAAKCHLRLDLQSFLPRFAIIDTARDADAQRAWEVCADIKDGEIVIFDRAYVDFTHLWSLTQRGVLWVTRAKENLQFDVVERYPVKAEGKIVSDELVGLANAKSRQAYPELMRRVVAWVEVDGQARLMTFLSNQLTWSPESIAELYRCRWQIEVFFKQIKQTLQLADFLGTSANAVRWQVWTALLVYLLLRYLAFLSNWAHSFNRLFAIVRTCLWRKWDLLKLLAHYGTAGGSFRYLGRPEQAYFPGFV
jgi:IS4 transposase